MQFFSGTFVWVCAILRHFNVSLSSCSSGYSALSGGHQSMYGSVYPINDSHKSPNLKREQNLLPKLIEYYLILINTICIPCQKKSVCIGLFLVNFLERALGTQPHSPRVGTLYSRCQLVRRWDQMLSKSMTLLSYGQCYTLQFTHANANMRSEKQ